MLWRLLILISIFPPIAAMLMRWWFGIRVLATHGPRLCRADLNKWLPQPGNTAVVRRSEETANIVGHQLWQHALEEWRKQDAKAAKARMKAKRVATVLSPFTVMIAVFAIVLGKMPILAAFAVVLGSVALSVVFAYLSLAAELREVARAANRLRKAGTFRMRDDEDAVIQCAMAHAWHQAMPPYLRWMQGG